MQVWLLDMDRFVALNGLKAVTNPVSFERGMLPSKDGLFSTEIFGITTTERKSTYAYIDLGKRFLAPKVYLTLKQLNRNFECLIYGTKRFRIENGELIVDENGQTGIDFLYKNWEKLDFKKNDSLKRNTRVDMLNTNKKNVLFIDKWVVMPAFYRDVNLQQSSSGKSKIPIINDKYNAIIRNVAMMKNANNFDFMMYSIEGKIEDLMLEIYNLMKEKIEKKRGYMRQYVMSKSVDYSFRAVITATSYRNQDVYHQKINSRYTGVPLSFVLSGLTPFVLWWVRRYFKGRLENNKRQFPIKINETETVYVRLDDPEVTYSEDIIERYLERWINDPSSRFEKVVLPINKDDREKYNLRGDYYLGLVGYNTTTTTMQKQENYVERPITWTDIFYMAAVDVASDKHIIITRYPLLDYLGTYISRMYVISTRQTIPMIINDVVYDTYPVIDLNRKGNLDSLFIDSLKIPPIYLSGLDGDHDGDQVTGKIPFSQEANEEAEEIMNKKTNIITINGGIIRTVGNEAIQTLYTLTRFH